MTARSQPRSVLFNTRRAPKTGPTRLPFPLLGLAALLPLTSCGIGPFGDSADCSGLAAEAAGEVQDVTDGFDGDGPLTGYVTNNAEVLPDVTQSDGRYRAVLVDNAEDKTLHFFDAQGRLDARLVSFPFDYVARNIGIGTEADSQTAPAPDGSDSFVFAGVQVHDPELDVRNSSHVVVGHRGGTTFTVEGKNTCDGVSAVNDVGADSAPDGRADIRIVGNEDRTLTVYYQEPNPDPGTIADSWTLYGTDGSLPGTQPSYGETVYIGLITYAQGQAGIPFVGTADGIEDYRGQ